MKADIIKQFNLPKYIKGKSFADASKAIDKKFEDRKDNIAKQTKEEMLTRLAKAQEYVKMQQSLEANSQEVPDQMNGEIPEGMEQFMQPQQQQMQQPQQPQQQMQPGQNQMFNGGRPTVQGVGNLNTQGAVPMGNTNISTPPSGLANQASSNIPSQTGGQGGAGMAGGIAGAANTAMELGQTAFGDSGVDTSGKDLQFEKGTSVGGAAAGGAVKGAAAGASFGPYGAAIGAVVGGAAGYLGGTKANKDIALKNRNVAYSKNNMYDNDFALGGTMNKYAGGGPGMGNAFRQGTQAAIDRKNSLISQEALLQARKGTFGNIDTFNNQANWNPNNKYFQREPNIQEKPEIPDTSPSSDKTGAGKALDWLGDNYGSIASFAPAIGNALTKFDKPNTERGSRLDNRYKRELFDEASLENKIAQSNIEGALSESSGGDLGALRSNILAAGLNKEKVRSDAYARGKDVNRNENRAAQEFNLNVDRANIAQDERYIERKARDEGAYNSAKNARNAATLDNIGAIGREVQNKETVKNMFDYNFLGRYLKKNPNATKEEIKKAYEKEQKNKTK